MRVYNNEKEMKVNIEGAVAYVEKNFKKPATYQEVFELYEKFSEKATKSLQKKDKLSDKLSYNFRSLDTIVSLMEYLNASTTQPIEKALIENEQFIKDFTEHEKNKIFERNKQQIPTDTENDRESEI